MRRRTRSSTRVLPDGTPLHNRLLAALPTGDYKRIAKHLRLQSTFAGDTLHEHGRRIDDVYFPNGGVFSVTNRMRDGALVEVAMVGREGMLGLGVFLGDRAGAGDAPADDAVDRLQRAAHGFRSAAAVGCCKYTIASTRTTFRSSKSSWPSCSGFAV